jgi:hypothetical protein
MSAQATFPSSPIYVSSTPTVISLSSDTSPARDPDPPLVSQARWPSTAVHRIATGSGLVTRAPTRASRASFSSQSFPIELELEQLRDQSRELQAENTELQAENMELRAQLTTLQLVSFLR